jgi:3-hydroxybutyryl-CoA dehydratase
MDERAEIAGYKISDIEPGLEKQFKIIITEEMCNEFAKLSGDYAPLHMNEEYGRNSSFNRRICHGLLLVSFFSRLIGMHLPGENALCISQSINYMLPAFIGDEITVKGLVLDKSNATRMITLRTTINNSFGKCLIDGQAKVLVRQS